MISIFTPVHKTHKFFEGCIDSILNQTFQKWEWIVLDNSSEHNIKEFIHTYIDVQYGTAVSPNFKSKIKVYNSLTDNHKIGYLKNVAANLCIGDILCEHDYDDYLMPNALEALHQAATNTNCNFFYSDWINLQHEPDGTVCTRIGELVLDSESINIENKQIEVNVFGLPEMTYNLLEHKVVPLHLRAWKREFFHLINGFNSKLEIMDDFDIMLKSFVHGKPCRISYPCCVVNYYNTNTTNNYTFEDTHKRSSKVFDIYKEQIKNKFNTLARIGIPVVDRFIPSIKKDEQILELENTLQYKQYFKNLDNVLENIVNDEN